MTAEAILYCMATMGYPLQDPDKCCDTWIDAYDSTPPRPAHFNSITDCCDWLAANYGGSSPCA